MKIIGNMKISWDDIPSVLTKIEGRDLDEIKTYCAKNNLTIVEAYKTSKGFRVQEKKPNLKNK